MAAGLYKQPQTRGQARGNRCGLHEPRAGVETVWLQGLAWQIQSARLSFRVSGHSWSDRQVSRLDWVCFQFSEFVFHFTLFYYWDLWPSPSGSAHTPMPAHHFVLLLKIESLWDWSQPLLYFLCILCFCHLQNRGGTFMSLLVTQAGVENPSKEQDMKKYGVWGNRKHRSWKSRNGLGKWIWNPEITCAFL